MTLGQNLTKQRKARNLSQQAIAERMNVERATYSRWERDLVTPSLETLKQLAIEFGMSLDSLCDFVSEPVNRVEPVNEAKSRLRDMGVKFFVGNKTVVVNLDEIEYVIDKKDLPELVKETDNRYKKLQENISRGLYQSALTLALNSGVINISQQYGKDVVNEMEIGLIFWLEEHDEKLTPKTLATITKKQLLKMPMKVRAVVWEQLIEDLVTNSTIDPDEYEAEKEKWACPMYKARKVKQ